MSSPDRHTPSDLAPGAESAPQAPPVAALEDLLEACRPGGDDLLRPEMAEAARRIAESPELIERFHAQQDADRRLAAAFRDVRIPEGLAERIVSAVLIAAPAQPPVAESLPPAVRRASAWRRPRFLAAAGLAALLAIAAGIWALRPRSDYDAGAIVDYAQAAVADADALAFRPGFPPDVSLPPVLMQAASEGWAQAEFLERRATFVRLNRNGVRATLIVVPRGGGPRTPAIKGAPPRNVYTTGSLAIGILNPSDSRQLYVLAVEGDANAYRRFLSAGAVA